MRATREPQVDISFPEIEKFDHLPEPRADGATAFVSIMEGCSRYCSFCVVPYTRGEEMSRPFAQVVAEVASLVAQGVREITLLGQNVNAYRGPAADGSMVDLAGLIRHIAGLDGLERIRFTTSHPLEFSPSLVDAYAEVPKLANYLHLPVQSGSDRILALMKRGYTRLEYKQKIRRVRAVRPDISLSSDFIVGFPGETEADFQQTLELIAEVGFDQSFSFIYSKRPGTPAASLPGRGAARGQAATARDAAGAAQPPGTAHQRGDGRQHPARAGREALAPRPAPAGGPHGEHALGELRRAAIARRPLRRRVHHGGHAEFAARPVGRLNAALESSVDFGAEDNARLAAVCGPLDENLHQIENRLGIEIRRRSGRFSLRGANAAAGRGRAAPALRALGQPAGDARGRAPGDPGGRHGRAPGGRCGRRRDAARADPRPRRQPAAVPRKRSARTTSPSASGPAGTGKTYLAVACAVEAMQRESVRRLVLVRPAVEAGERLGFLPGDLTQKVDPYLRPMYDALYEMIGFDRVARLIERNVIEVAPLAFMRGRTLNESFIILDEAQNTTVEQMKMFLTRIGFGSRAVVTGDVTQTDLPAHRQSGLRHALEVLDGVKGIAVTRFTREGRRAPPARAAHRRGLRARLGRGQRRMSLDVVLALPHAPALGAGARVAAPLGAARGRRSQGRARHPRRGPARGPAAQRALARARVRDQRACRFPRRRSSAARQIGDIVVCAPVVAREAREQGKSLAAHWAHMIVHGTLHLLGFDHVRAPDAKRMEGRERALLARIGIADPYGG